MGLFGVTQEIRFVLNDSNDSSCKLALEALDIFQEELTSIQAKRIKNDISFSPVEPIGKVSSGNRK